MSDQLDHFVVANSARIPCTIRTLRQYEVVGNLKPWVHSGELSDALLYLAKRAELPPGEILALKELLESLSSSLKNLSDSLEALPDETANTNETLTHNTPANKLD